MQSTKKYSSQGSSEQGMGLGSRSRTRRRKRKLLHWTSYHVMPSVPSSHFLCSLIGSFIASTFAEQPWHRTLTVVVSDKTLQNRIYVDSCGQKKRTGDLTALLLATLENVERQIQESKRDLQVEREKNKKLERKVQEYAKGARKMDSTLEMSIAMTSKLDRENQLLRSMIDKSKDNSFSACSCVHLNFCNGEFVE
ncbi:uncharacterized protein LOC132201984 [Neocloeon triangulifer]|uniref:uncharacterized protein LOC132201984 n=1 Tax=Neocloeon triangulifer TaxID=2078957 RepID=UPI00286F7064|nr:uncharacterized protein LOC132201984 [Neocloeon triangulifer]